MKEVDPLGYMSIVVCAMVILSPQQFCYVHCQVLSQKKPPVKIQKTDNGYHQTLLFDALHTLTTFKDL